MHIPFLSLATSFFFSRRPIFISIPTISTLALFLRSHLLSAPVVTIGSFLEMRVAISRERTSENGRRKRGKIGHQDIQKFMTEKEIDEPDAMTRVHKSWAAQETVSEGEKAKRYCCLSHGWGRHSPWSVQCNTTHLLLPAVVRRCCCYLARRCVRPRGTCRLNHFVLRLLDQRRKPRLASRWARRDDHPGFDLPETDSKYTLKISCHVHEGSKNMLCFTLMRTSRHRNRDRRQYADCGGRAVMCYS